LKYFVAGSVEALQAALQGQRAELVEALGEMHAAKKDEVEIELDELNSL